MSQHYDDMYLKRGLENKINNADTETAKLNDSQFEQYGKVGGMMVKRMVESYEESLLDKSSNNTR